MTEHPILFNGPMVRAILAGRKTQTRRVVKRQSVACVENECLSACQESPTGFAWQNGWVERCPYGQPGDTLWVRETWRPLVDAELLDCIEYKADDTRLKPKGLTEEDGHHFDNMCENIEVTHGKVCRQKWKPSIFMPRWASRITLKITDVRVQLVQEISEEDARAEGVQSQTILPGNRSSYISGYYWVWEELNNKRGFGWDSNPYVWAITFEMFHGATGKDGK
jgi:hypothetical protein